MEKSPGEEKTKLSGVPTWGERKGKLRGLLTDLGPPKAKRGGED